MTHESCQNFFKSMKHCGLPPHPPLQINRKIRKGIRSTADEIKAESYARSYQSQRQDENTR